MALKNHAWGGASDYKCNELGARESTKCLEEPHVDVAIDVCNRSCCRPRRTLTPIKGEIHGILNSFLGKDDLEYDLDDNSSHLGLLSFSPPVRTSNPLVSDVKFIHQNLVKNSSLENSIGGTNYCLGAKVSCHGTSETPTVRIEGFESAISKSQ